jgi:hypothetical protein
MPATRLISGTGFPDRIAVIAAPAHRIREPAAQTKTAVSITVSVVFRVLGRVGVGDMPRLGGKRVHQVSIRELVSKSCSSPSVTRWSTTKARCPTRQSPSPR